MQVVTQHFGFEPEDVVKIAGADLKNSCGIIFFNR
jgi:hypothetical protein